MGRIICGGRGTAWGRSKKKAETRKVMDLTEELMADVEWWRRRLTGGLAGREEELAAPCLRSVKQPHSRAWFSDASFKAVGGLCLETGACWRYTLTEEERARTTRSRKGVDVNRSSINVFELPGMVMAAFEMIVIRKDRPARVGGVGADEEAKFFAGEVGDGLRRGQGRREIESDGENLGGVEADRVVVRLGKTSAGGGERVGGRDNEVEGR